MSRSQLGSGVKRDSESLPGGAKKGKEKERGLPSQGKKIFLKTPPKDQARPKIISIKGGGKSN